MSDPAALNELELTTFERTIANSCTVGDLIVMGISFLNSKTDRELKKSTVQRALEIIQERHPFFRAYLDIRRDEDRMSFILIDDKNEYKNNIELEWASVDSRDELIELNSVFNAKLFKDKKVDLQFLQFYLLRFRFYN